MAKKTKKPPVISFPVEIFVGDRQLEDGTKYLEAVSTLRNSPTSKKT